MSDVPSAANAMASAAYAIAGFSLPVRVRARIPSKIEKPPPAMKMPKAASNDQK
jgi:hypothetical protein